MLISKGEKENEIFALPSFLRVWKDQIMTLDLNHLSDVADAAPSDKWRRSKEGDNIIVVDNSEIGCDQGVLIASFMGNDNSGFFPSEAERKANVDFVIAFNPQTVRELLDRLHRAEEFVKFAAQTNNDPAAKLIMEQAK
jgi:hypothetical protein